jgi:hypothetical protein
MRRKMIHLKVIFSIGIFLAICNTEIHATNFLYVREKSGTQTAISLSTIKKLTFPSGNLMLTKTDGSTSSFALTGLRSFNFASSGTTDVKVTTSQLIRSFALYPNPVVNDIQINYESSSAGQLQLEIIDLQGRLQIKELINIQTGTNSKTISVANLQKGIYVCRMINANKSESVKFLKN